MYWFKPGAHLDSHPFHPKMLLKTKMERTIPTRVGVRSKTSKAKSIILRGVHNHRVWPSPAFRMSKFSKTVQGVSLGGTAWTVNIMIRFCLTSEATKNSVKLPHFYFHCCCPGWWTPYQTCDPWTILLIWWQESLCPECDLLDGARKARKIQTPSPKSYRWDDKTWKSAHRPLPCLILTIIRSPAKSKTRER